MKHKVEGVRQAQSTAENELRRAYYATIRSWGLPRPQARRMARKAAEDAIKIIARFGPRRVTLAGIDHGNSVTCALLYDGSDLKGTMADVSDTMQAESFERVLGAGQ